MVVKGKRGSGGRAKSLTGNGRLHLQRDPRGREADKEDLKTLFVYRAFLKC